jgi:iron complex outermembrane receptor protein
MTKDPRKYQGTTIAVSAGNHYVFSGRLRHAERINNKWSYKITGEYSSGKEYAFYDSVYVTKYSPL